MSQKILILTRHSLLGASSRYRFYDYIAHLKQDGFDCAISMKFLKRWIFVD